jgi:hypothetical protein
MILDMCMLFNDASVIDYITSADRLHKLLDLHSTATVLSLSAT